MPDSALEFVLLLSRLTNKKRYWVVGQHAPVVPLTIIDGIDFYVAFRPEESNIQDVQNLATCNPIMLHIESPFEIYQTIDWVAQAQLCTIVGPDRFLLLKQKNICAVFDLRQAVIRKKSNPEIVAMLGAIILCDTVRDRTMRKGLIDGKVTDAGPTDPTALPQDAIRRLTEVMLDDLHVHR